MTNLGGAHTAAIRRGMLEFDGPLNETRDHLNALAMVLDGLCGTIKDGDDVAVLHLLVRGARNAVRDLLDVFARHCQGGEHEGVA